MYWRVVYLINFYVIIILILRIRIGFCDFSLDPCKCYSVGSRPRNLPGCVGEFSRLRILHMHIHSRPRVCRSRLLYILLNCFGHVLGLHFRTHFRKRWCLGWPPPLETSVIQMDPFRKQRFGLPCIWDGRVSDALFGYPLFIHRERGHNLHVFVLMHLHYMWPTRCWDCILHAIAVVVPASIMLSGSSSSLLSSVVAVVVVAIRTVRTCRNRPVSQKTDKAIWHERACVRTCVRAFEMFCEICFAMFGMFHVLFHWNYENRCCRSSSSSSRIMSTFQGFASQAAL